MQSAKPSHDQPIFLSVEHDDREVTSGESEADDDAESLENSYSFVGISIGREQTRLASPGTPAAEREAILFEKDDIIEEDTVSDGQSPLCDPRSSKPVSENEPVLPARRFGQSQSQGLDGALTSLRNFAFGRPRASTTSVTEDGQRKFGPFTLPSLAKLSNSSRVTLPNFDAALNWLKLSESVSTAIVERSRRNSISSFQNDGLSGQWSALRRSASDTSLSLHRAVSEASSLGDDSRWLNVHEQVNSRMKALKDSLADSSLKLPNIRASFASLGRSASPTSLHRRLLSAEKSTHISVQDFGSTSKSPSRELGVKYDQLASAATKMKGTKLVATSHPQFSKAMEHLTGDVVVLGGYRGSVLRSADPPHKQLWVPVKVGLNIRKVNLEVGLTRDHEHDMESYIIPGETLSHIGPVDISRRLLKRLRASRNARNGSLRVWEFGYDWRLSPHLLSQRLKDFLSNLPCNSNVDSVEGATVIAHSLGGLLTRHVVNNRPELVSGVVYAGVPQYCVNILGPLRNGDAVLLSSRVLTAQVNFTFRTSFALLPLDGNCFVDKATKERYHVDFFDPSNWEEYRLSPCIARPLPPLVGPSQEHVGLVGSIVGSMATVIPSLSSRRNSSPRRKPTQSESSPSEHESFGHHVQGELDREVDRGVQPQIGQSSYEIATGDYKSLTTTVTIPKLDAVDYLTRTLREVKQFKQELVYNPELAERYPPIAVLYGKSVPTVVGAYVNGRDGIKRADSYDNLAFASGDGVVLARAAQAPEGYRVAKGGVASSNRGHVGLLGDLEAVGQGLVAILAEKKRRCSEIISPNRVLN